jgi:16S rRNA (cytosine967-C5)-methyltransferase
VSVGTATRLAATDAVAAVLDGQSLDRALPQALRGLADAGERAAAQALAYGVLRWHLRLQALLLRLLQRPPKARDRDVQLLLELALFQLLYTDTAPYAAVNEAVEAVAARGKRWARGLANAVLRRAQRESTQLLAEVDADPALRHAHPAWLVERLRAAYPDDWTRICSENNAHPPMVLRVSAGYPGGRDAYLRALSDAGIAAETLAAAPQGLVLSRPVPVERLPAFDRGAVSVQDAAAQLAAPLLGAAPGEAVLDACAAPGGKLAHLLECMGQGAEVDAVEVDAQRAARIGENLDRLGLRARLHVADALAPRDWARPGGYRRILLDAPCSATGVIRRHPDIKLHRRRADLDALVRRQQALLQALWPLLEPGGILLYATCSVMPEENELQIARFLSEHPDAVEQRIDAAWGQARPLGRQILPGEETMDGFFYARLRKPT